MERKSHDQIMVHNPLSEPYQFRWGGFITLIPSAQQDKGYGKGNALLERGHASKYVKEITDKVLTQRLDEAVRLENERRIKGGMKEMDKHQEEIVFATPFRIDNPELRHEVLQQVWLGVYHEYGMDVTPSQTDEILSTNRPIDEQLLETMEKPYVPAPTLNKEKAEFNNSEALEHKSQFELRSIAKGMGLDVAKTDKKNDIISRIQQS